MPANAFLTHASSAKLEIKAAIREIIIIDGRIMPKVAAIPPAIPARFRPIKVAVFTAIIPGVHCPTAK